MVARPALEDRGIFFISFYLHLQEFLSLEKCIPHVVIRGLVRVTMCEVLKDVLDFLTLKGRINFGIVGSVSRDTFLNKKSFKVIDKCNSVYVVLKDFFYSNLFFSKSINLLSCCHNMIKDGTEDLVSCTDRITCILMRHLCA